MSAIKRILCPTDFSPCARTAVAQALVLAQHLDAELCILHVIVLHGEYPMDPMFHFPAPGAIYDKVKQAAELEMGNLLAKHQGDPPQVSKKFKSGFDPGVLILDYAKEHEIDLIVMGTHGRRGARRLLLGSVAEEVVRHASCPVLTLHEPKTPWTPMTIGTIVAPVDFSSPSENSLRVALELARDYQAQVDLLHVIPEVPWGRVYGVTSAEAVLATRQAAEQKSSELLQELGRDLAHGVTWKAHTLVGHPAKAITRHAEEVEADLIVIGTEGHTGLDRVLLGSTTEKVLRLAGCGVLTVSNAGESIDTDTDTDQTATV